MAAAVRAGDEKEYRFVPDPAWLFAKGDRSLLIGKQNAVQALKP